MRGAESLKVAEMWVPVHGSLNTCTLYAVHVYLKNATILFQIAKVIQFMQLHV